MCTWNCRHYCRVSNSWKHCRFNLYLLYRCRRNAGACNTKCSSSGWNLLYQRNFCFRMFRHSVCGCNDQSETNGCHYQSGSSMFTCNGRYYSSNGHSRKHGRPDLYLFQRCSWYSCSANTDCGGCKRNILY